MSKILVKYTGGLCTHVSQAQTKNVLLTDADISHGGIGGTFSPTDLMAAALASCMATMAGMISNRLGIALFGLSVEIEKVLSQTPPYRLRFKVRVRCTDHIDGSLVEQIEGAMRNCPVHQSLAEGVIEELQFNWSEVTST